MEIMNSHLKSRKSVGEDNISCKLIYEIKEILAPLLQHIFNTSVIKGIFPNKMKIAKVIAIPKTKFDLTAATNYRPISLLSNISKIFETIMSNRIKCFLNKYNILYDYQYGFREKYSTTLALIDSVDEIRMHLGKNKWLQAFFWISPKHLTPLTTPYY